MKKVIVLIIALSVLIGLVGCNIQPALQNVEFKSEVKGATKITADISNQVYALLDFTDEQDKAFAERGFVAAP